MDISDWRGRIDTVDRILVDLINRRMEYVLEIGKIKGDQGRPVRDAERERTLLAALKKHNRGPVSDAALDDIFRRLIEEACDLEDPSRDGDPHKGGA